LAPEGGEFLRQNSIVSLIATFEAYLAIVYIRAIYISPETMQESKTQLLVKDIASSICGDNPWLSFAGLVATKILWNMPLSDMIYKISSVVKFSANATSQPLIDELVVFSSLRNAIVHNSRRVTPDLNKKWRSRFVDVDKAISTESRDVLRLSTLCLRVAELIDNRFIVTIIKDKDGYLLSKELFVRYGLVNGKIREIVNSELNIKINSTDLDIWMAKWRRDEIVHDDYIFSESIFTYIAKKWDL